MYWVAGVRVNLQHTALEIHYDCVEQETPYTSFKVHVWRCFVLINVLIYICECSLSRRARLAGVSFRVWGNDVMRDGCCLMQAARLHYSTNASTCTANHPTFQQIRHQRYLTRSLPIATRAACGQACTIQISHLYHAHSSGSSRPATASEAATYARMTFKLC